MFFSMGIAVSVIKDCFIAMFLQQNKRVGFLLEPTTYPLAVGHFLAMSVWVLSHGVGLTCSQKVVGYSCSFCATIAPMCLAGRSLCV